MNDEAVLINLPDGILSSIFDFLNLVDCQRWSTTCRALRARGDAWRALLQTVQIASRPEATVLGHVYIAHMTQLVHLNLANYATDEILLRIAGSSELQHLRSLSMVGSLGISDRGLEHLSTGRSFAECIQSIDITYCHNTTYAATFSLRDNFHNLRLLRRQPVWMDGSFETPFQNDGLHTYYADGSFQFEREQQSSGYVMHVEPWNDEVNPYCVFDKLQYSNSDLPNFLPPWARFFYRPGVSLLRITETEVLVGQTLRGLRPPRDYPRPEQVSLLPQPKMSVHLNRQGDVAADDDPDRHYLISRMRVFPLSSIMPPPELVEKNRVFCRQLKVQEGTFGAATEDLLHLSLGGE